MSRVRMEIYQLKTAPGTSFRKSQSLKGLKTHGMKLEAGLYELVYASDLTRQGNRHDVDILEEIYDTNPQLLPDDCKGTDLGVSDVVILEGSDGSRTAYYCDLWSWPDVTDEWEASKAQPAAAV